MQQERKMALSYSSLILVWECPHKHGSVPRYCPECPCYKCSRLVTEITTAHLHLIVQGCSLWKEKKILEIIHGKVPTRQHLHWGSPRDSTRIAKSCCETWSKKRKWSVWGVMEHSSPSHGTNWDQEIRYWADLFASSMQHWSGSLINCFLVQFFLQTMTFYPSFFKSCINFTVKHLSSPISIQQNTYFKTSDY